MIERKKLGKIATFEYGYTASASSEGTHRFIRITDISAVGKLKSDSQMYVDYHNFNDSVNLRKGDLLIARTGGTFGKSMIFSEDYPAVFASFLIRINFKIRMDPTFIWLYAQSDMYWKQANKLVTGGTQPQFNANSLALLSVPVTDYDHQKEIVSRLTPKIEAIAVLAEKTERQLQDTASLAACINKQTIEIDRKKQPISMYCSEDKRIIQPESEDTKTLEYLGMENIDKDTWAYIASTDILVSGKSTTYYFDENHVLYGKLRPYLKKVFLPELAGRCSTELIPLLPADTMEREYLALLLTDDDLVSYIMSESTGARMPRTDMKKLLSYKVAVPDIEEQRTRLKVRNEQMKKCTVLIEKLRKQKENIAALRACAFKDAFGNEE